MTLPAMDALTIRASAGSVLHFRKYYYQPDFAAAVLFIVLFGISTTWHLIQMIRSRTWFMIPFVLGGIFETVGYIGRTISAKENPGPYELGPFVLQSVLLLVAPAFFAASVYMELGRIVLMIGGEKALFIRRTWVTKIFVAGDVICFLLQAGGAGLLSTGSVSEINTGNDMVIGGLFVQVVFFGLFVIASAIFHVRMRKAPTELSAERPWQKHMIGLYLVSMLIFVRSTVRCAEYIEGFFGYIITHEVFLYCFDATPMFFVVVAMNWSHPGEVAKYVRELRAKRSAETEAEGAADEVKT